MKKTLLQIILSIAVVATTASLLSTELAAEEQIDLTLQKVLTDDEALKELIRRRYDPSLPFYVSPSMLVEIMQGSIERANTEEGRITLEQDIKVMESMVCAGLADLKNDTKNWQAREDVNNCMIMLSALPDYDVIPLLNKCLQVSRYNVLLRYIQIKKADAIPFLRQASTEAYMTDKMRSRIYSELESQTRNLQDGISYRGETENTNAIAKITAFLQEMKQPAQSAE